MSGASLQNDVLVQFVVGLVVITAMFVGGGVGAVVVGSLGFPYADVVGVFLGSLLVFLAFVALYARSNRGSAYRPPTNRTKVSLTDDLRALPELQRAVSADVAISPIVLRALVDRGVLERSEGRSDVEVLAERRGWLGAPIYDRARSLFED